MMSGPGIWSSNNNFRYRRYGSRSAARVFEVDQAGENEFHEIVDSRLPVLPRVDVMRRGFWSDLSIVRAALLVTAFVCALLSARIAWRSLTTTTLYYKD